MKELRSKNQKYCLELSNKPENRVARIKFPNGEWNQPMYEQCMEKRGTPTYGAYVSEQVKKKDAELRARGEIFPPNI